MTPGAGEELAARIEALAAAGEDLDREAARGAVEELLAGLEDGSIRAAEPDGDGWRVHPWVKTGILLGFRVAEVVELPAAGPLEFRDKELFPPRSLAGMPGVRLVPGGSAVRRGAYLAPGTVLMPPCYVNVGAFVDEGTMIDSHALVGSCAQVGRGVHVSAGAQVGGVLEPPGALPVIVEDGAFLGGLVAVLEGVRVRRGAVLAAGVVLTRSTPVYDLVRGRVIRAGKDGILEVPENAVVVPGVRALGSPFAREHGLSAACALIVKDRDEGTSARASLEEALR